MQIDFNRSITFQDAVSTLRAFAVWWGKQLLSCVPGDVRDWFGQSFERWTLVISGASWLLLSSNPSMPQLEISADGAPEAQHLLIAQRGRASLATRIYVQLPRSDILIRRLRFPAAVRSHLRSVVRLQLERLSPFLAKDVQFDCHIVDSGGGQEIDAEVAIVPKEKLLEYEKHLNDMGLVVRKFVIEGSSLGFSPARWQFGTQDKLQLAFGIGAFLLWSAVIALAPQMRDIELRQLTREVSQLRPAAQEAGKLRASINRVQLPLHAAAQMLRYPSPLDILDALTKLLPDETYVRSLTIARDDIRMSIETTDVAALSARLHQSKEFRVAYMGTGKAPQNAAERIDIELTANSSAKKSVAGR